MKNKKIFMLLLCALVIGTGTSFYAASDLTNKMAMYNGVNGEQEYATQSDDSVSATSVVNVEEDLKTEEVEVLDLDTGIETENGTTVAYVSGGYEGIDSEESVVYDYDENDELVATTCFKGEEIVNCDSLEGEFVVNGDVVGGEDDDYKGISVKGEM